MVLAGLISFGILLVAWIASPSDEPRLRLLVTQEEPAAASPLEPIVEAA